MIFTLPKSDLQYILELTEPLWQELKNERIFITGGTGFFGSWIVESFLYANSVMNLRSRATILTRNSSAFIDRVPCIATHDAIELHEGTLAQFPFLDGQYAFIIHAAIDSIASCDCERSYIKAIQNGANRILDFALKCKCSKLLFTSSGAVYGRQPPAITHLSEDFQAIEESLSLYGKGKRLTEEMCCVASTAYGFEAKIARCFAFVGPYLPMDRNFAAGNFIRDAISGDPIHVTGDGTSVRSYLYAADLAVWLWTILFKGQNARPYNVGSEQETSILELAELVSKSSPSKNQIVVDKQAESGRLPERYVPSTAKAKNELSIDQLVDLPQAIQKSIRWCRDIPS